MRLLCGPSVVLLADGRYGVDLLVSRAMEPSHACPAVAVVAVCCGVGGDAACGDGTIGIGDPRLVDSAREQGGQIRGGAPVCGRCAIVTVVGVSVEFDADGQPVLGQI